MEDRNGNLLTLSWQSTNDGGIYTFTDPVNRTTTVNYTESLTTDTQDVITYPGYNGNSRIIRVNYSLLQNAATEPLETYHDLFPELSGSSSTPFNPYVISSIVLADGSQYTMQYNAYGELAKLTLPTGAYYTYSYWEAHGSTNGNASGVITLDNNSGYRIMRPLRERDEYADGVNLSAKLVLEYPGGQTADPNHNSRPTSEGMADFKDANGNILRKEMHFFYGSAFSTAAPPTDPVSFAPWWEGLEFQTYIADGSYGVKQVEQRVYGQRPCASWETCTFDPAAETAPAHDPQLCQMNTAWGSSTATTLLAYDQYNNVTDKWEYDFASAIGIGASCLSAPSNYLRRTNTTYVGGGYLDPSVNLVSLPETVTVDEGNTVYSKTHFGYDETSVTNAPGIVGHDNTNYAGNGLRGNLTNPAQCLNPPACSTWANHGMTYDIAGNVITSADGNGNVTTFGYNDDPNNPNIYARVTSVTNAAGQKSVNYYDAGTGKLLYSTDVNNVTTGYEYNDLLDRLTKVSKWNWYTNYVYNGTTSVMSYEKQTDNWDAPAETDYDGLGRTIASKTYEDPSHAITTYTTYNALGLTATVSNPMRAGDALYQTTYAYDPLGRTVSVTAPDGAATSYSYTALNAGLNTTVTDAAGKEKAYITDALGRLTAVYEDPAGANYATNYAYDPLGDLTSVVQGYCPNCRTFTYDALQRLTDATNPESGHVHYDYDNAGNLVKRTDNRGVVTQYTPDVLNRVASISYSDGTPAVNFYYDTVSAYGKGRLASVCKGNYQCEWIMSYDPMGRVTASTQNIMGNLYSFSYGYNYRGALTSETYPSGRVVNTVYDTVNRPYTVSGALGGQTTNYVTAASYAAQGGLAQVSLGNSVSEYFQYNSRLQMNNWWAQKGTDQAHALLWLALHYDTPGANNGNLQGVDEYVGGLPQYPNYTHFAQSFTYDGVNRLNTANEPGGWSRNFGYDPYGNMWTSAASGVPLSGLTPTSNVFSSNWMSGRRYDLAGNQIDVGTYSLTYDAENQLRNVVNAPAAGGGSVSYSYGGNGKRVIKQYSDGGTVFYVYDVFGQLAAEYSTSAKTANPACGTCYITMDHLGSTRLITDVGANVVARHDFLPFGEEVPAGTNGRDGTFGLSAAVNQKFTGQERDQETNLDYFFARYLSAPLGRFLSPDPSNLSVDFHLPQTWNRYSYALNNPLEMVDRNGLWPWPIHNQIISQAFPGMSADQLKTLRNASWNMDYGPGQQDASKAYQHGMSDGLISQDPSIAEEEGNDFIAQNERDAQKAQADWLASGHAGISPKALAAFGNALHTIVDRTSPAHVGNQPWYGTQWWKTQSIIHYQQERKISPSLMQTAMSAAQQAFRDTFGNEFGWLLLLMNQGGACVTAYDSASGTAFGGCQ